MNLSTAPPGHDRPARRDDPREGPGATGAVTVSIDPLDDVGRLRRDWQSLEARADGSFFLSWGWIGCWLDGLPAGAAPRLLRVHLGGRTVALAVLVPCRRAGWVPLRRLWLHETGDRGYDALTVEYNGFLVEREVADRVLPLAAGHLLDGMGLTSELRLSGVPGAFLSVLRRAAVPAGRAVVASPPHWTYGVDLRRLGEGGADYLASLGTSTRHALRRSIRLYERSGPLSIRHAGTAAEALAWFDALRCLHEARWHARGKAGAFADARLAAFHRRLIAQGVPAGTVRLSRIAAGEEEVGYLYSFVWRGRVHNYQNGFRYAADNRLKPGMVSHFLAVMDFAGRGDGFYDFMAGGEGYKQHLGVAGEPLHDVRLLSGAPMAWLAERARGVRAAWRGRA